MRRLIAAVYCSTRFLITWLVIALIACLLYGLIIFVSLINKNVIPTDDGPLVIPYINVPTKYDVMLEFSTEYDKSNLTYTGSLQLTFVAEQVSERIYLHSAHQINIQNYHLTVFGKRVSIKKGLYNAQTEIQTFIPISNLTIDTEYILQIDFKSKLNFANGPQEYTYDTGTLLRYGISFISSRNSRSGLRYLFPCMDSSDFPALFNLNIKRKSSLRAITNHPSSTTEAMLPFMMDSFPAKSRLYPNQVALVLTDFPSKTETSDDIKITVYFRTQVLPGISIRRLRQFMDKSSSTIGKIDAVVIPHQPTIHQPGLSIMNEEETLLENKALSNNQDSNL